MVTTGRGLAGRVGYGLLFVAVLPALLVSWAIRLDAVVPWRVPDWHAPGLVLAGAGALLALAGMRALIIRGRGLPMNAYPPRIFVTDGVYALLAHPIYAGAFLVATGASLWMGSAAGLVLVTPALGLMMVSLVYGYERPALRRRFGAAASAHRPWLALPPSDGAAARGPRRLATAAVIAAPWLLAGYAIDFARHDPAVAAPYLAPWQLAAWSAPWRFAWLVPGALLLASVLLARTNRQLRHASIAATAWAAAMLYLDVVAPPLGNDLARSAWWLALVAAAAAVLAAGWRAAWDVLRAVAEAVANSRRDWLLLGGRLRIVNHAAFSFTLGAVAAAIGCAVLRDPAPVLLGVACVLAGAALYAQLSWGSGALLRPFGFWGSVPGLAVALVLARVLFGTPLLQVALAAVLAAPFAQAVGRLRCLAQGCCHGVPCDARFGIRVWQAQSRVVVLSKLAGAWILPTQLFSILFNLALGPLLVSMWLARVFPATLVVGTYFFLAGIERFAEDAYRGETQTRTIDDLKEPQWIALGSVVGGMALTIVPSPVLPAQPLPALGTLVATAITGGLLTAFAMSVDFPRSHARFSRLSG